MIKYFIKFIIQHTKDIVYLWKHNKHNINTFKNLIKYQIPLYFDRKYINECIKHEQNNRSNNNEY